jgi:alkylated DNA repair protein (DNA oxidative demethylase)
MPPSQLAFLLPAVAGADADPRPLAPGAALLPGLALADEERLLEDLAAVTAAAPFRHMLVPGGHTMSVAMTSCGPLGWVSDTRGYRYDTHDPESGRAWPPMPPSFAALATRAAARAGFAGFFPDACLVNRYTPGARLSLHQDKDERDYAAPIVSVSLGLPATFLFGGATRAMRPERVPLAHGDVVVWGGPARLRYHGVLPLADGQHPRLGAQRINLTLRRAAW